MVKLQTTLFDLAGGHPALDLVNSLDNRFSETGPVEILATPADLGRFLSETHLLEKPTSPSLSALHKVRELREATASVLYAHLENNTPPSGDLKVLERYMKDAANHRELQWPPEWHWHQEQDLPVWLLAQSVSDLLFTPDNMQRLRMCDVHTCRWLFLDTSKNHSRRWCNMKVCGNRVKARRFQSRQ
jgi:predicted RNA-binding Zn ribbon-like protein